MKTIPENYSEPDNFDYKVHIIVTRTLACIFAVCAFFAGTGCTINRTGSILPDVKLIEINDSLNGSANNNEIPLLK